MNEYSANSVPCRLYGQASWAVHWIDASKAEQALKYLGEMLKSEISQARWKSQEGYVEMRCKNECWIDFRTPSAQAEREAELRAREKTNAAKPKAP